MLPKVIKKATIQYISKESPSCRVHHWCSCLLLHARTALLIPPIMIVECMGFWSPASCSMARSIQGYSTSSSSTSRHQIETWVNFGSHLFHHSLTMLMHALFEKWCLSPIQHHRDLLLCRVFGVWRSCIAYSILAFLEIELSFGWA